MIQQPSRNDKLNSLITLAQVIVLADAIESCKKSLLNQIIWDITLIDHTWNMRYWSEGVHMLVAEYGSFKLVRRAKETSIRREHVNTRKSIVSRILNQPSEISNILREDIIACNVTQAEHKMLSNSIQGFQRYKLANIRVWDTKLSKWLF